MPSPFPGMDPYLEHPELWPALHHLLISEIFRFLSPQLRPKYLVSLEVRIYETADDNLSIGTEVLNDKKRLLKLAQQCIIAEL